MMTNLFSIFDPSSSLPIFNNWLSVATFLIIIPSSFWVTPTLKNIFISKMLKTLHQEIKLLMGTPKMTGYTIIFISLLIIILINNFYGLFPYIFTATSHLLTNLTLALPLWISIMLFGWIYNTNHMFTHLVPQSTPPMLMSFMVLIESISNLIRPGTLAVRLTANMIAGHLLMTLLGNQTATSSSLLLMILVITQMFLLMLESAVSMIQAYVFTVLASLYSSEVN